MPVDINIFCDTILCREQPRRLLFWCVTGQLPDAAKLEDPRMPNDPIADRSGTSAWTVHAVRGRLAWLGGGVGVAHAIPSADAWQALARNDIEAAYALVN